MQSRLTLIPIKNPKGKAAVFIQAYLNKALGADDFYDDFSNASLHGLMSLGRREWIDEFAQALGIPCEM